MPPGVRKVGRGIEVVLDTAGGGLNPLRGPSASPRGTLEVYGQFGSPVKKNDCANPSHNLI